MRDCVCTDTSSGQQSCNENGTSYGLCVCGHVATDGGEANQDAGAANDDASMTMRGDGGGMMMRGDGGGMMMRRDGSGMMMGRDGGGMMMPPQEAYDACTGKMEGDDCTWNNPRRGEVMGTCQYRRGESQLFCRRMGGGGMGGGGMGGGGMGGGGGN